MSRWPTTRPVPRMSQPCCKVTVLFCGRCNYRTVNCQCDGPFDIYQRCLDHNADFWIKKDVEPIE